MEKDKGKDISKEVKGNILGVLPIPQLIRQFAVPSIVAMLVGALYNIYRPCCRHTWECGYQCGISADHVLYGCRPSDWYRRSGRI